MERAVGSENIIPTEVGLIEGHFQLGLASCLSLACLDAFKILCQDEVQNRLKRVQPTKSSQSQFLKHQLGRFHLWGKSLSDGSLDKAVEVLDDLKRTVLVLLCDISREVLSSKPFLFHLFACLHSIRSLRQDNGQTFLACRREISSSPFAEIIAIQKPLGGSCISRKVPA